MNEDISIFKIITLLIILFVFIFAIHSCNKGTDSEPIADKAENGMIEYQDLNGFLIADRETHIIYYRNYDSQYNSFMCPYYSKNGNLCKYENGKIIEVGENDNQKQR